MQGRTVQRTKNKGVSPFKSLSLNDRTNEAGQKKLALEEAIDNAMAYGSKKKWEKVIDLGIAFPAIMDRICNAFYQDLPDLYKYSLPVHWYMQGGESADSVAHAIRKALKYRPEQWIGKGYVDRKKGIDVYIATRSPLEEVSKIPLWSSDFNTAYLDAQRYGGRVYKGYLSSDKIIAVYTDKAHNVLQYNSVTGIEIVFPNISSCYGRA